MRCTHECWGSWQMLLLNHHPLSITLKGHGEQEKCMKVPVQVKCCPTAKQFCRAGPMIPGGQQVKPGASSVPFSSRRSVVPWDALGRVLLACQERWSSHSTLHWWGHIQSDVSRVVAGYSGLPSSRKTRNHWRRSRGGLQSWWGDWTISLMRKGACVVWKGEDWEGILPIHTSILRAVLRGRGQTLFSCAQWEDKGQWAQTETQEAPSEYKENLHYCGSDRSLEQAPEKLWSPSLEILKTHLDTSSATSSGWVCLRGGVGLDDLQSPFLPQPFCDSMK